MSGKFGELNVVFGSHNSKGPPQSAAMDEERGVSSTISIPQIPY